MVQDITATLRDSGFKVTPQRLAVYDALTKTKEHPNAEMLYSKLRPHYPTMSLATVYKTVDILAKLGLIKVLNTGEDSFRYDADVSDHAHLRCLDCKSVCDVYDLSTDEITEEAERKTGYSIASKEIYFFGACPDCKFEKKN